MVMIGWAIFMCDGYQIGEMVVFFARLFGGGILRTSVSIRALGLMPYIPFLIIAVIISTPLNKIWIKPYNFIKVQKGAVASLFNDSVLVILFFVSIIMLISGTYNPFIYFRF